MSHLIIMLTINKEAIEEIYSENTIRVMALEFNISLNLLGLMNLRQHICGHKIVSHYRRHLKWDDLPNQLLGRGTFETTLEKHAYEYNYWSRYYTRRGYIDEKQVLDVREKEGVRWNAQKDPIVWWNSWVILTLGQGVKQTEWEEKVFRSQ